MRLLKYPKGLVLVELNHFSLVIKTRPTICNNYQLNTRLVICLLHERRQESYHKDSNNFIIIQHQSDYRRRIYMYNISVYRWRVLSSVCNTTLSIPIISRI